MAGPHILNDVLIDLGGERLEARARSIRFARIVAQVDTTNMGSGGAIERLPSLYDGVVEIDWQQDFTDTGTANRVYRQISARYGMTTTLKVDPTDDGARHQAEVEVYVNELPLFEGAVGELSRVTTSWPFTGEVVFDPGVLWATTMMAGDRGTQGSQDQTGFNKDGTITTHYGRLSVDRAEAGVLNDSTNANDRSRLIRLYIDESDKLLYMRTNRVQDFRDRWIRVGDDWLEMHPVNAQNHGWPTGTGSGNATFRIEDAAGWDDNRVVLTEYSMYPVGIYDRAPTLADVLPTDPIKIDEVSFTAGNAGQHYGYNVSTGIPTHGTPTGGLDFDVPYQTEVTLDRMTWERDLTGTGGTLHVAMDTSADAVLVDGLWMAVKNAAGDTTLVVRLQAGTGAGLDFFTDWAENPGWDDGDVLTVEFWDRDPR